MILLDRNNNNNKKITNAKRIAADPLGASSAPTNPPKRKAPKSSLMLEEQL